MKGTFGLKKGSVPFKNDLETILGTWYIRTYPYTLARTYYVFWYILIVTYVHINMYIFMHTYWYIRTYVYIRIILLCLYI